MKIITKQPKIYDEIKKHFPHANWEKGLIITYGKDVYCKVPIIGRHKEVHETVHIRQQAEMGKDKWWALYFENAEFRLLQEIEAYTAEHAFLKDHTELTTREQRRSYRKQIIEQLSGPIYGNIITYAQAEALFK